MQGLASQYCWQQNKPDVILLSTIDRPAVCHYPWEEWSCTVIPTLDVYDQDKITPLEKSSASKNVELRRPAGFGRAVIARDILD